MTRATPLSAFVMIFVTAIAAHLFAADPTTRPSGTVEAERRLEIDWGDGSGAGDIIATLMRPEVVRQILQRHGVPVSRDDNIRTVLLKHGAQRMGPRGRPTSVYEILVRIPDDPHAPMVASEIADEILSVIQETVQREWQEPRLAQLERIEKQVAHVAPKLEELTIELRQEQEELRHITGRVDASPQRIREELQRLEQMRQEAELEQEARAARLEALTERSARLAAEIERKVEDDPVLGELQKVVEIRKARLDRIRQGRAAGAHSELEHHEAMATVAEARARLFERRAEAARAAGGDILMAWHREMANLGVDSAELRVRTRRLSERLQRLGQATETMIRVQDLERQLAPMRATLDDLELTLANTQRAMATMQPARVIVQHAEDRTERTAPPQPPPGGFIDPASLEAAPNER